MYNWYESHKWGWIKGIRYKKKILLCDCILIKFKNWQKTYVVGNRYMGADSDWKNTWVSSVVLRIFYCFMFYIDVFNMGKFVVMFTYNCFEVVCYRHQINLSMHKYNSSTVDKIRRQLLRLQHLATLAQFLKLIHKMELLWKLSKLIPDTVAGIESVLNKC